VQPRDTAYRSPAWRLCSNVNQPFRVCIPALAIGDSMDTMNDLTVRRATTHDVAVLAALIDEFAKGHPAEGHERSVDRLRDAFFGNQPMAHVLLAEKNATVVGFGVWRKAFDVFWSLYGGDGLGLYVIPSHRGRGVAVCIVAAMCAEIREQGGHFLQTSYDADLCSLYERVGVGRPERTCQSLHSRSIASPPWLESPPARSSVHYQTNRSTIFR
jgi:GNAT superfamily N-acetyltransferase